MADFCRQCGGDDFVGLRTPEMVARDTYPLVLCEGCGPIQVDCDGSCISEDCIERHGLTDIHTCKRCFAITASNSGEINCRFCGESI